MEIVNPSPEIRGSDSTAPPAPGVNVLVQCDGYRCLAYLDAKGDWRNAFNKSLLFGVLHVLEK